MRLLAKRIRLKLKNLFDNRTALLLLLFGLILLAVLLAFFLDALGIRTAVYRGIYGRDSENGSESGEYAGIPNMTRPLEEAADPVYFNYSEGEILSELVSSDRYTRAFRIVRQWREESSADRYTLTVDGDYWEISGASLTAFGDGERAWIQTNAYAMVTEGGFYDVVGITPLETVMEKAQDENLRADIQVIDQNVRVNIADEETGIQEMYEISIESGLILSEQSAYWGNTYRTVATEIVADLIGNPLSERCDALKEEFYANHPELRAAEGNDGGTP